MFIGLWFLLVDPTNTLSLTEGIVYVKMVHHCCVHFKDNVIRHYGIT